MTPEWRGGWLEGRQNERVYLPEQQRPLNQWNCRRDCDSEPWVWLRLPGSTARAQSPSFGPWLFRVMRRGDGWEQGTQGRQKGLKKRWIFAAEARAGGTEETGHREKCKSRKNVAWDGKSRTMWGKCQVWCLTKHDCLYPMLERAQLCDHTATCSKQTERRGVGQGESSPEKWLSDLSPTSVFPSMEDLPDSGNMEDLFPRSFWSWMPFTEKMEAAENRKGAMKHLHSGCLTCCSVCTHYLPAFGPDPRGSESTSVWGRLRLTPAS